MFLFRCLPLLSIALIQLLFSNKGLGQGCGEDYFYCPDGECIPRDLFCDGHEDCIDGADEITTDTGVMCLSNSRKKCVLPDYYVCDDHVYCMDFADECNNMCVNNNSFFCDGLKDCGGGIDECLCDGGKRVDSLYSDDQCFRCLDDSRTIPIADFCDGIIHCKDLSDECLCGNDNDLPICNQFDWDKDGLIFSCSAQGSPHIFERGRICDGKADCDSKIDELDCEEAEDIFETGEEDKKNDAAYTCILSRRRYGSAVPCDGIPTCPNIDDECNNDCDSKPDYCEFAYPYGFYCIKDDPDSTIHGNSVCDGKEDCIPEGQDEKQCPNSTRFYCDEHPNNTENIARNRVCDLKTDCFNSMDESNCQVQCKNCKRCETKHFYCDAKRNEFVDCRRQVCDGSKDCSNGADECQNCTVGIFSDDDRMISATPALPFMWIISLIATIGNILVIVNNCSTMIKTRGTSNEFQTCQRILILNLATADLLVGIYTLAVSIQNVNLSHGRYCNQDHEWRSSATCNFLGVILTMGCEASVFMLAIITTYRLNSVYRPYAKTPKIHIVVIAAISWLIALIIAVVPLAKTAENYFVESKWFGRNPIVRTVNREELESFTTRLIAMKRFDSDYVSSNGGKGSWKLLEEALKSLNPEYVVQREFGYYSAHGVCLPKLFPIPSKDAAWGFSFFVIFINFLMFLFICVTYILIYRRATGVKVSCTNETAKKNARLQIKITRMVVTDFLCWIPICIMTFIRIGGGYISDDVYVPVGTILIPINSMLNPFLYSEVLDWIWVKLLPLRKFARSAWAQVRKNIPDMELQEVRPSNGGSYSGTKIQSGKTAEQTLSF